MNSLESQIQREAASAAAEITPADIPPLRLRAGRARPSRPRGAAPPVLTGQSRSAGTRRWVVALAAAASVVALLAVMVALRHNPSARHLGPRPASPAVSRTRNLLADGALDSSFPATGGQYTAGLAFQWTEQKITTRLIGSCMAQAGFPLAPLGSERSFVLSAPDNSQFPDLAQRTRTRSMIPAVSGIRGIHSTHGDGSRGFIRAQRRCTARYAKAVTRLDNAAAPLVGPWLVAIGRIQSSARIRSTQPGFASCLEAHGVPARYAVWGGNQLFSGFFAFADTFGQTSASTKQYLAWQRRWTPVFVRCARPVVTVMERLQLAQRARFFHRHAGRIALIRSLAMDLAATR